MAKSYRREEEEESGSESENDQQPQQFAQSRKLFEDEHGRPIKFYFHRSIKNPGAIAALTSNIEKHGGRVLNSDKGVNTVLVDPLHLRDDIETIRDRYNVDEDPRRRNVYVERQNFIQHCIRNRTFRHTLRPKQGIGGARKTTGIRVGFTEEDEENLTRYLALKVPDKESGGRSGNNLYMNLVKLYDRHDPERYAWVQRHTWSSWRERYVKNKRRFDAKIAEQVPIVKPSNKHMYFRDRRLGRGGRRRREEEQEEEEEEEEEEESGPSDDELIHQGSDEYDELDEDDEDILHQDDLEVHQRKRKRPEAHEDSLSAESQVKRQRTYEDSSSQHRAPDVEQGRNLRPGKDAWKEGKGKEKAEFFHSLDDELHSLFSRESDDPNEPGPSEIPRSSPSPSPRRLLQHPTALPTQPQSSQITLVNPETTQVHRQVARKKQSMSFSSRQADASRSLPAPAPPIEVDKNEITQTTSKAAPRARMTQQPTTAPAFVQAGAVHQASSGTSPQRTRADAAPPIATMSQTTSAAVTKKPTTKEPKPPVAAKFEAPYRNTRSRSRSVEPSVLGLKTTTRGKRKGKGKGKAEQQGKTLEPLNEVRSEADELIVETVNPDILAGETLAEEQDVEDLLIADGTDQSGIGHRNDDDVEEVPHHSQNAQRKPSRENSLNTDDQQILKSLPNSARQPPTNPPFDTESQPADVLKNLKPHKLSKASHRHQKAIPSVTAAQRNPNRDLISTPSRAVTATKPNPFTSPRTPGPSRPLQITPLSVSQSSGESLPFPVSGTRASAVKNRLEQEGKRSPYNPPAGTRAARHAGRK